MNSSIIITRKLVVSDTAAVHYPLLKGVADQGVDDVADVAARHLADLAHDGQRIDDLPVAEGVVEDVVEGEELVLGDGDDLHVVAVDGL